MWHSDGTGRPSRWAISKDGNGANLLISPNPSPSVVSQSWLVLGFLLTRLLLVWTNLKPKLVRLLEANRALELEHEKAQRRNTRKTKLNQLLNNIKLGELPLIDAEIRNPAPPSMSGCRGAPVEVLHQRIFPAVADLLDRPIIKSLVEADVSIFEMEARFKRHQEEIDVCILEWRLRTERHLANLLRKGRVSDGLEPARASILPVEGSEPDPFGNISADLKLLLRADSLFESASGSNLAPVTYYFLVSMLPIDKPLDLTQCKRHAEAQMFARVFLAELGKPNASFLEMKSEGYGFMCARCHSNSILKWENMVRSQFIFRISVLNSTWLCRPNTIWTRNEPGRGFKFGSRRPRSLELRLRTYTL